MATGGANSSQAGENRTVFGDLQIPPFRSVDDFILDKARFERPPFNDLPRWNNRIVSNLLHYQTNYFAVFVGFLLLSTLTHDLVIGLSALALVAGVAFFAISSNPSFYQMRRDHPLLTLGAIVVALYYLLNVFNSVLVFTFVVAFPLLLVLIHASVRLRNFQNKVNQKLENLGLRVTVMGRLLELLNIDVKAY